MPGHRSERTNSTPHETLGLPPAQLSSISSQSKQARLSPGRATRQRFLEQQSRRLAHLALIVACPLRGPPPPSHHHLHYIRRTPHARSDPPVLKRFGAIAFDAGSKTLAIEENQYD
jgi:hypothetical protein